MRQESQHMSGIGTRVLLNAAIASATPVAIHSMDERAIALSVVAPAPVASDGGGGGGTSLQSFLIRFSRPEQAVQALEIFVAAKNVKGEQTGGAAAAAGTNGGEGGR
jgi:hypothetical protein